MIQEHVSPLAMRLSEHTVANARGWYVPQTVETSALRQTRLSTGQEIDAFLAATSELPREPMGEALLALVKPSRAPSVRPWVEGYERAIDVREALGWGNEPAHELKKWLTDNHVSVNESVLASSIAIVSARSPALSARTTVNPNASSRLRREIGHAAALGHILFDESDVMVEGTWEHWPAAARARAFGVMFLLPIAGVRDVLLGKSSLTANDVQRVMQRFGAGPYATTYHLMNYGFMDDERRTGILRELMA